MSFLKNLFKRKKLKLEETPKKREPVKKPAKFEVEKEPKAQVSKVTKLPSKKLPPIPLYLKETHVTEKATALTKQNQYIFKIYPKANKVEIRKAIEGLYNVKVEKVRIVQVPGKKRRLGRLEGYKKGYKKAIVKLKEGQKIEVLPR